MKKQKREMKNQKRNATNEKNNPTKREISKSGDHNSNNNDTKK